jgi:CheY-like chemotaxis protein
MSARPILVVDDDPAILAAITDVLVFEGYEVEVASNGLEGLRMLEASAPGLVMLDMRMPVLDGWEFARQLKERGLHLPVVVMTAAQDARRWATEIGADAYIEKPFDLTDLLTTVARHKQG